MASISMSFLILLFCFTPSLAQFSPTNFFSPQTLCKYTPHPYYCSSLLLDNPNANVYDSGRFSVHQSLSQARKFSTLVQNYLTQQSNLNPTTILALQDCQMLADLNIDFLSKSANTVDTNRGTLSSLQADETQTLLSAILTNQQTCLDGLQPTTSAWSSVWNSISAPISNDTKLHSVSLALFSMGWVPDKRWRWQPSAQQLAFRNGRLPLIMSSQNRAIFFQWISRLKLMMKKKDESIYVRDIVVVSKDGCGNFTTINDAVDAAPTKANATDGYFLIYITAGVYEEYVSIPKNKTYLMMIGEGINRTVITGNRSVLDGSTTFNSATFAVVAPGFVAVNITFRNTAGAIKHQAVALRSGADMSTFYKCSFEGYQDSLYTHSMRQFYRECDIYGTVDFIFGNAAVVLQKCNIYPRLPIPGQFNSITAQGRTDPNQNTGISIQGCTIKAADDLASSNGGVDTYLGRPWKEYSRTVYMNSDMDSLIDPTGWRDWNGTFALKTLYYAEYNNTGLGSDIGNRVTWPGYRIINPTEAANFTASVFLMGNDWLPRTGVPYY